MLNEDFSDEQSVHKILAASLTVLTCVIGIEQFEQQGQGAETWENLDLYLSAITDARDSLDNYNLVIYRGSIPGEKNYVEVSEPQIVKGVVSLTMAQKETTDDGVHRQIGQVYQVHKSIHEFQINEMIFSGLNHKVQLDLTESAFPSDPLNCKIWEAPCYQCLRSYSGGLRSCEQQCQSKTPAKGICYSWF